MSGSPPAATEIRHATTVAVAGRGLMIEGPSGSGKSALALEMMAHGARLVADDRTRLRRGGGAVAIWAEAPEALPQLIEARGIGLLPVRLCGPVPLVAILRLDRTEAGRLPEPCRCTLLGCEVALLHRPAGGGPFAPALLQYLKGPGLKDPP